MSEKYSEIVKCKSCKNKETVRFKDTNQGPDWYTEIISSVTNFEVDQIDDKSFTFLCLDCNAKFVY